MSARPSLGPGGQPLTRGLLPPGIFDPKVNGVDWYTYAVDLGNHPPPSGAGANLAAGATASAAFTIQRAVDFYLTEPDAAALDTAGGIYGASTITATVSIYDSGTVRQLVSAPVPIPALFSNPIEGAGTMILPRLFRSMSTVTFTVTNQTTATVFTHLWLIFQGYRIYLES